MSTKVNQPENISKEEMQAVVNEYCESKNLSQRELATKCGVSDATINHIVNGKWEQIRDSMWRKVWNVVSEGKVQLFNTNDHNAIATACDFARKRKLMIGIVGDTGMGKTTSLKIITRKRHTYFVSYDKTMKAKQFFAAILKEMGVAFEGSIYDMVNRIADELNTCASPLLIIDEAGKITHNVMLYMHCLRDRTDKNCGIVLAGMPYFKTNLQKNSNKQKEGFAEFFRRIQVWHELKGLSWSEIKFICNQNGITDEDEIREYKGMKRFGDLSNELLLHQIDLVRTLSN